MFYVYLLCKEMLQLFSAAQNAFKLFTNSNNDASVQQKVYFLLKKFIFIQIGHHLNTNIYIYIIP